MDFLPDELLLMIFDYLPFYVLQTCAMVCHHWNELAHDNQHLQQRLWIQGSSLAKSPNWYRMMIELRKLCRDTRWAERLGTRLNGKARTKPVYRECPFCGGMLAFRTINTIQCFRCLLLLYVRRLCSARCTYIVDRPSLICVDCFNGTWCWACEQFTGRYTGRQKLCRTCHQNQFRICSVCYQPVTNRLAKRCPFCPISYTCQQCSCPCTEVHAKSEHIFCIMQ